MTNPKYKLIFSPQLAVFLLHCGYSIVDLKPKRENPDETIYVFVIDEGFYETIDEWKRNKDNM